MKIVDEIRNDHRLIDEVAGSLHRWAHRGANDPDAATDRTDLARFLRVVLIGHHHLCEEKLFNALVKHGEIPGNRGPLVVLRAEHETTAEQVARFAAGTAEDAEGIARELAAEIWQHLDKEESVLLPEAERRLIDGGIRELDPPPSADHVEAVRALGFELVRRLPPMDDPELIRGEGCIPCPAFAGECHGIEAEWWSDWERAHYAGLDEG
jgi:hemerythrin-like domain-containing protein